MAPPQSNVTFTGDLAADYPSGPLYRNADSSAWGATNNISSFYAAYNSTYLFLGLGEVVTGNSLMIFLGDGGASSQGTYNLTGLNAWGRAITFNSPVLSFAAVYFGGSNSSLSGYGVFEVTSPTSQGSMWPRRSGFPSPISSLEDLFPRRTSA